MSYIDDVKAAILHLHGCEAIYVRSEDVLERFGGGTVWEGVVEIFDIKGHPKAKRCYAWGHRGEKNAEKMKYVAVLELPPVDSASKAVQVAIAGEYRSR